MILMQLPLAQQSVILQSLGQAGGVIVYFIFVVVCIVALSYLWIIPTFRYPITVGVSSTRGKGKIFQFYKGRWKKDKKTGEESFELWMKKADIYPPTLANQYPKKGIFSKNIIFFDETDNGNFFPLNATDTIDTGSLFEYADVSINQKNLYGGIMGRSDNTYRPQATFMEKYGHYMGFALLLVGSFVIVYLTLGKVGEISQALAQTGERVAQAMENVNSANIGATP